MLKPLFAMFCLLAVVARAADVPVSILDPGLAARELGWHCATSFEDGLARTLEWARSFEAKGAGQL